MYMNPHTTDGTYTYGVEMLVLSLLLLPAVLGWTLVWETVVGVPVEVALAGVMIKRTEVKSVLLSQYEDGIGNMRVEARVEAASASERAVAEIVHTLLEIGGNEDCGLVRSANAIAFSGQVKAALGRIVAENPGPLFRKGYTIKFRTSPSSIVITTSAGDKEVIQSNAVLNCHVKENTNRFRPC